MRITTPPPIGSNIRVPSIGIRGEVVDKPQNQGIGLSTIVWAIWTYEKSGELMSGGRPLYVPLDTFEIFLVDPPEDILWD